MLQLSFCWGGFGPNAKRRLLRKTGRLGGPTFGSDQVWPDDALATSHSSPVQSGSVVSCHKFYPLPTSPSDTSHSSHEVPVQCVQCTQWVSETSCCGPHDGRTIWTSSQPRGRLGIQRKVALEQLKHICCSAYTHWDKQNVCNIKILPILHFLSVTFSEWIAAAKRVGLSRLLKKLSTGSGQVEKGPSIVIKKPLQCHMFLYISWQQNTSCDRNWNIILESIRCWSCQPPSVGITGITCHPASLWGPRTCEWTWVVIIASEWVCVMIWSGLVSLFWRKAIHHFHLDISTVGNSFERLWVAVGPDWNWSRFHDCNTSKRAAGKRSHGWCGRGPGWHPPFALAWGWSYRFVAPWLPPPWLARLETSSQIIATNS